MQQLCQSKTENDGAFYSHSITAASGLLKLNYEIKSAENVDSFKILVKQEVVSKGIIQKFGNSGPCIGHIELAYSRGGRDDGLSY